MANPYITNRGEERSIAEFDIQSVPDQLDGDITQATFEVQVSGTQTGALGQRIDAVPSSISVYGYVGNGMAEQSDFQAGTLLDTIDTTGVARGDILTFDITDFIDTVIADNASFAGLAVRANDFGGITVEESNEFPQLRIQTDGVSDRPAGGGNQRERHSRAVFCQRYLRPRRGALYHEPGDGYSSCQQLRAVPLLPAGW